LFCTRNTYVILFDKDFSWLQIITIHFATATDMKTDLFDTLLHIVNVGSLEVIAVGGAARNAAAPPLPKYKALSMSGAWRL
jgi:hypothetical protein